MELGKMRLTGDTVPSARAWVAHGQGFRHGEGAGRVVAKQWALEPDGLGTKDLPPGIQGGSSVSVSPGYWE